MRQRALQLEESHARLQESEERLRLASEAANLATFEFDQKAQTLQWSANISDVLHSNLPEHQTFESFVQFVHRRRPRNGPQLCSHRKLRGNDGRNGVSRNGCAGRRLDSRRARAFSTGNAETPRVLGTLLDITDRKSAESHQQLLMAELDHRVKNILANVAAIARLSSSNAVSARIVCVGARRAHSCDVGCARSFAAKQLDGRRSPRTRSRCAGAVSLAIGQRHRRRRRARPSDVKVRPVHGSCAARTRHERGKARRAFGTRRKGRHQLVADRDARRRQDRILVAGKRRPASARSRNAMDLGSRSFAALHRNAAASLK